MSKSLSSNVNGSLELSAVSLVLRHGHYSVRSVNIVWIRDIQVKLT